MLDGKPLDEKLPLRSLFFGEGVFETFRWRSKPPVFLEKHILRLKQGAEYLSIPFPGKRLIKGNLEKAVSVAEVDDNYVKICLLSSGPLKFYKRALRSHILVVVREYEPSREYLRVNVAATRRNSTSSLLWVKSINYLENVIARRVAEDRGYDESVFLNERGEVTEGSYTNIFWIRDDALITPALECGLLPGITREALISLAKGLALKVEEGRFDLNDMLQCTGAFLTNSLMGMSAIKEIDKQKIPVDEELFRKLRSSLFQKLDWPT